MRSVEEDRPLYTFYKSIKKLRHGVMLGEVGKVWRADAKVVNVRDANLLGKGVRHPSPPRVPKAQCAEHLPPSPSSSNGLPCRVSRT